MDYRKKNSKASKLAAEAKQNSTTMMVITQNSSPLEMEAKQRQKSVSTKVCRRFAVVRNPVEDEYPMMQNLIKFIHNTSGEESGFQAINSGEDFYKNAYKI